jgi:hypothetical protein
MDESGIMKLIPQKAKEKIMSTLLSATKLIAKSAGDMEEVEKIQGMIVKTSK